MNRLFYDPTGQRYGLPTWPYRLAPAGLATRRQLAGQILWRRRAGGHCSQRLAYLYDISAAVPKRPLTPARAAALEAAIATRRWCPACQRDVGYCISRRHGMCGACIATADNAA